MSPRGALLLVRRAAIHAETGMATPQRIHRVAHQWATSTIAKLIRAGRFIDLYGVVRQGLRAGIERYSIKNLEVLYGFGRGVPLADANRSLLVMAQALATAVRLPGIYVHNCTRA